MNENPRALRRRRIEAGLSQTDLALKAGVTKSHLSSVEKGRAGFSPKNLKKIAQVLGCQVHDLLLPEPDDQPAGARQGRPERHSMRARSAA